MILMNLFKDINIKDIITIIISIIALVVSIKSYESTRPKLKIFVNDEVVESFYYRNENKLLTCVKVYLFNSSPIPITVNALSIENFRYTGELNNLKLFGEFYFTNKSFSYKTFFRTHRRIFFSYDGVDINSCLELPRKLEPYEFATGYAIFPYTSRSHSSKGFSMMKLGIHTTSKKTYYKTIKAYKCFDLEFKEKSAIPESIV